MYDVLAHARMLRDRVRGDAYARAIAAVVKPGDVVIDLGCGTGVHAILAARAGARIVYAIETDDVIQLARELATANGCADRIEFIQARSRDVELPARANVIVSDIRGVLPFFRTAIADLIDARERLLAPGGTLIPLRDTMHAALVSSAEIYRDYDWREEDGVDLTPLRRLAVSDARKARLTPAGLLSETLNAGSIDYAMIATPDFRASLPLRAMRDGVAHGIALWFDAQLSDDVQFSNVPGGPETIYGQSFLPFEQPVPMREGDAIEADIAARLVNDDDYLWRWLTTFVTTSGERRELFRQSNFFGVPL